MNDFNNKVAVITGGASGIGAALAEKFGALGASVMLADTNRQALAECASRLVSKGIRAEFRITDVSRSADIETLLAETIKVFDGVHILCNNAGIADMHKYLWEYSDFEIDKLIDINLSGVFNGVRVFLPYMLSQKTECHIINTSSMHGFMQLPCIGLYELSKHGVVTFSETLSRELEAIKSEVKVSILMPATVATNIGSKPLQPSVFHHLAGILSKVVFRLFKYRIRNRRQEQHHRYLRGLAGEIPSNLFKAISADNVAGMVVEGIRRNQLYIYTHHGWQSVLRRQVEWLKQSSLQGDV